MTILDLQKKYQEEWTCSEHVKKCYDVLKNTDNKPYISLIKEDDLNQKISDSDSMIKWNSMRKLDWICVSIKDLFLVEWEKTTGWSSILKEYISPYSATVVKKILDAGWIIISKDNCDMFWHWNTNRNTAYWEVHNALDASRVAWWSSWWTAVTVAIWGSHFWIWSDTWWSIRQPSVYNWLVWFKPSYWAVSRSWLMSYASSLDTVWPIAKNTKDINFIMNIIGGKDELDMTSFDYEKTSMEDLENFNLHGKKVGFFKDFLDYKGIDSKIKQHISDMQEKLSQNWVEIVELPFFPPEVLVATYYIIAMAETASNLSRLTGIPYWERLWSTTFEDVAMKSREHWFSEETKKRIIIGNQILSTWDASHYYQKAIKIRKAIIKKFEEDFKKVDFIISPISPNFVPKVDDNVSTNDDYLNDMYTVWFSLGKNPTLALPSLPFSGIQISWAYKNDSEVLKFWHALEQLLS